MSGVAAVYFVVVTRDVAVLSCVAAVVAVACDVAVESHNVAVLSSVAAVWVLRISPNIADVSCVTVQS